MNQIPAQLLLGVGNGAVFGALALALVLTYRSSGVLNLATSAVALYAAYTFAFLRQGQLFIPIPGLPSLQERRRPDGHRPGHGDPRSPRQRCSAW